MKKFGTLLLLLAGAATMNACAYGGVAASGDKVVVAKNNGFLFGILNSVYVCDMDSEGLKNCKSNESP